TKNRTNGRFLRGARRPYNPQENSFTLLACLERSSDLRPQSSADRSRRRRDDHAIRGRVENIDAGRAASDKFLSAYVKFQVVIGGRLDRHQLENTHGFQIRTHLIHQLQTPMAVMTLLRID